MTVEKRLTEKGVIYRTQRYPREQAFHLAKTLAADPKFDQVLVVPSRESNEAMVEYQPANPSQQVQDLKEHQMARSNRSGQGFTFQPVPNQPGEYRTFSVSGNIYQTSLHRCTCPDFQYRCASVGLSCKHMEALAQETKAESDPNPPLELAEVGFDEEVPHAMSDKEFHVYLWGEVE